MRRSQLAALPLAWWGLSTVAWAIYVANEIRIMTRRKPGLAAFSVDFEPLSLLWLALGIAFLVLWLGARRRERRLP